MRASRRAAAAALLIAALSMIARLPGASAATTTVPAEADAFVISTGQKANRGGLTSLRIRNNVKVSYVRFNVPALPLPAEVSAATLRVFATTGSSCSLGVEVLRAANDTWGESTITWSNQPGTIGPVVASASWTAKGYRDFDVTSAVTGAGPVSFVLRHPVGCNVTADVTFSSRESTANQPQLVVETDTPPPAPACSDGLDNDADGQIDFPADTGCVDAVDTDETNAVPPTPACSDGIDNDADGLIDFPADTGCVDATDTDEATPPPQSAKVVMAAGDIVCSPLSTAFGGANPNACQHRATRNLLAGADAILPLGDLQYQDGTLDQFIQGYDPSWGQDAPITYPAVGNHEYNTLGAQGYFDYWASKGRPTGGVGSGYHSFDLGSWRLIALNSNCASVPCAEGSLQNNFLEQDLASTTRSCILAYWHHPLFNSGSVHGAATPSGAKAFWADLFAAGADIVLNGHEHNYQRYAKQDPSGQPAPNGIREFVVGSGGRGHYALLDVKDANYEAGNATDFGVLKLYLGDNSYTWEFVGVGGAVLDAGGPIPCN